MVLALMPNIMFWLCDVMGFQSPANMVYLIVIFLLVVKLFTTTLQLSHLNEQVMALTQALALHEMKENRDNGEDE